MLAEAARRYSEAELNELLGSQHASCWGVGLHYGSMVYFEMGDKVPYRLRKDVTIQTGSLSLVLESDEWTIGRAGSAIIQSHDVTRAFAETRLRAEFAGQRLSGIAMRGSNIRIDFSGGLEIELRPAEEMNRSDPFFSLRLPPGFIVSYNPAHGFVSDGSTTTRTSPRSRQSRRAGKS